MNTFAKRELIAGVGSLKSPGGVETKLSWRQPVPRFRTSSGLFRCVVSLPLTMAVVAGVGCGSSSNNSMPGRNLLTVAVQPSTAEATAPTETLPFTAVGTFDQTPTTDNVTAQWSSSDTNIATIDASSGQAQCIAVGGPVTITGSASGKQGTAKLTCVTAPQTGSGNCVYQCPTTRCGALTGYCSVSTGGACRQVFDPSQCPLGQPAGATSTNSCGAGIDTTRTCSH